VMGRTRCVSTSHLPFYDGIVAGGKKSVSYLKPPKTQSWALIYNKI